MPDGIEMPDPKKKAACNWLMNLNFQLPVERPTRAGRASSTRSLDHHHQRQAVDEPDQIRAASVEHAGDAELADRQEIIVRRILPINHP